MTSHLRRCQDVRRLFQAIEPVSALPFIAKSSSGGWACNPVAGRQQARTVYVKNVFGYKKLPNTKITATSPGTKAQATPNWLPVRLLSAYEANLTHQYF